MTRIEREMGASHDEILRLAPRLAGERPYRAQPGRIVIGDESRRVVLWLGAERVRRLGILEMPVTDLAFEFHGFNDEDRQAFLDRFNRVYQRGGG